jgi:hypothetical protein
MIETSCPDSPAGARAAALAHAIGLSVRTTHPEARPAVTPPADVTRMIFTNAFYVAARTPTRPPPSPFIADRSDVRADARQVRTVPHRLDMGQRDIALINPF